MATNVPNRGRTSRYARTRKMNIFHYNPYANMEIMPTSVLSRETGHLILLISDAMHNVGLLTKKRDISGPSDPFDFIKGDPSGDSLEFIEDRGLKTLKKHSFNLGPFTQWKNHSSKMVWRSMVAHGITGSAAERYYIEPWQYLRESLKASIEVSSRRLNIDPTPKALKVLELIDGGRWWDKLSTLVYDAVKFYSAKDPYQDYNRYSRTYHSRTPPSAFNSYNIQKKWKVLWYKLVNKKCIDRGELSPGIAELLSRIATVQVNAHENPYDLDAPLPRDSQVRTNTHTYANIVSIPGLIKEVHRRVRPIKDPHLHYQFLFPDDIFQTIVDIETEERLAAFRRFQRDELEFVEKTYSSPWRS